MLKQLALSVFIFSILSVIPTSPVYAASGVGRIVHTYGPAWIERGDTREKIRKGRVVLRNDSIITGPRGRVKIIMGDGSKVYIGAKSRISLRKYSMRGKRLLHASINMLWGKARFFVNKLASRDSSFRVRTSTAVLGVRGTEFSVWVPPTPDVLSRAFDKITLADIPKLPTRTVLMEGAVDVDAGSGIQYRLTPGNTADVDTSNRVRVRKTNNEDLEETSKPLSSVSSGNKPDDANKEKKSQPQTGTQKATDNTPEETKNDKPALKNKPAAGSSQKEKSSTKKQPANGVAPAKNNPSPSKKATPSPTQNTPKPAALPDNPQASDASAIMLGDTANTPLDQPSMPPPPAVAAPAAPNPNNIQQPQSNKKSGQKQGGASTTNNNAPPSQPAPQAPAPIGNMPTTTAGVIIPNDIQNAIQNLGTKSAVKVSPNFVQP
ncbi:MAG: FecR domain-containing protein [Ghiorsea sp.]